VLIGGALLYAAGLAGMALSSHGAAFLASTGVLIGVAQAGCTYAVVYGVIGRNVPAAQRSWAMGITAAADHAKSCCPRSRKCSELGASALFCIGKHLLWKWVSLGAHVGAAGSRCCGALKGHIDGHASALRCLRRGRWGGASRWRRPVDADRHQQG
jgi:hypothetical protein